MLDSVVDCQPGKSGIGIKNVTVNEPFFQGHFPERSIMPGVMIVEALAQLTAVVLASEALSEPPPGADAANASNDSAPPQSVDMSRLRYSNIAAKIGYLASIKNVKFMRIVVPGDQLILKVERKGALGGLISVGVAAFVGKEQVLEGSLAISQNH
jgi:3-hydroxyacyl-[acyl-carrier-protein] dehydratase